MVARQVHTGAVTEPVAWADPVVDSNGVKHIVPAEPHIGSVVNDTPAQESVQAGFVVGGTTNPPLGDDGKVKQLDNAGERTDKHPGEIAALTMHKGPQAALEALGGPSAPPGQPQPTSDLSGDAAYEAQLEARDAALLARTDPRAYLEAKYESGENTVGDDGDAELEAPKKKATKKATTSNSEGS